MKFVCEKNILSDSISIVSKAINNACAIDILKGIKIEAKDKIKEQELQIIKNTIHKK